MENPDELNELQVLTIDELRSFDKLNHLSDQEATEIIEGLKELSLIAHKIVSCHE